MLLLLSASCLGQSEPEALLYLDAASIPADATNVWLVDMKHRDARMTQAYLQSVGVEVAEFPSLVNREMRESAPITSTVANARANLAVADEQRRPQNQSWREFLGTNTFPALRADVRGEIREVRGESVTNRADVLAIAVTGTTAAARTQQLTALRGELADADRQIARLAGRLLELETLLQRRYQRDRERAEHQMKPAEDGE